MLNSMPPSKPNILWISSDQQRSDTIGALGQPLIRTPSLDNLVRRGVAFHNAYCQAPICTPSRASFLTGMYPGSIRACMNGNEYWADAAPLISARLQRAGYHCGLVGKLHLSALTNRPEPRPRNDGFQVFELSNGPTIPSEHGNAYADWLTDRGFDHRELSRDRSAIPPQLHQSAWCAERSIAFIESAPPDSPWFLFASFFDPHPIYEPPVAYAERVRRRGVPPSIACPGDTSRQAQWRQVDYEHDAKELHDLDRAKAGYYGMIELLDECVGRVLDHLESAGQLENTLIIFSSDHGDMMGDHGLIRKGCRFYDGLVKVPLIVSMPERLPSGAQSAALVELVDIAPTLLEAAGEAVPAEMHGRSLWSKLLGGQPIAHHRSTVHCEYYRAQMREGYAGTYATMVRDERYKLVVYHGLNLGELYDLHADPSECVNLWSNAAYTDTRLRLTQAALDTLALSIDLGPRRVSIA